MGRKEGAGRVPPVFLRSLAKTQDDTSLRPLRLLTAWFTSCARCLSSSDIVKAYQSKEFREYLKADNNGLWYYP